jgi:hypothetical protein
MWTPSARRTRCGAWRLRLSWLHDNRRSWSHGVQRVVGLPGRRRVLAAHLRLCLRRPMVPRMRNRSRVDSRGRSHTALRRDREPAIEPESVIISSICLPTLDWIPTPAAVGGVATLTDAPSATSRSSRRRPGSASHEPRPGAVTGGIRHDLGVAFPSCGCRDPVVGIVDLERARRLRHSALSRIWCRAVVG